MIKLYPEYGRTYWEDNVEAKPELNDPDSWQRRCIHFPDIISPRTTNHWVQNVDNKRVARYDFGEEENMKRYETKTPPEIDVSQIKDIPIAMFFGKYDLLVRLDEAQWARDHLDSSVLKHYEEWESGHHTFLIGKEVDYLERVQKLIREYSK